MFLIFGGESYYASGGCSDYLCSRDNLKDAIKEAERLIGRRAVTHIPRVEDVSWDCVFSYEIEWTRVFDCSKLETVHTVGYSYGGDSKVIEIR